MQEIKFREPLVGNVVLTADQKAVVQRELSMGATAFGYVRDVLLKDLGEPTRDTIYSALSVVESCLAKICKVTETELDSASDREERHAQLRAANIRIRELENSLGKAVTPEVLSMGLKACAVRLEDWWDEYGFGYLHDMSFGKWGGCSVKFSCNPSSHTYSGSDTPKSDRIAKEQWLKSLSDRGFNLTPEDGSSRDFEVLATDSSRELLVTLIKTHLPSADIHGLTARMNRQGLFTFGDIEVYIRDLQDIKNLKLKDQK